jgi:protein-serine/threonine kinase
MLSAPAVDLAFGDGEWPQQPITARFSASVGSWEVTSIGRGFNWSKNDEDVKQSPKEPPNHIAKLEALSQYPHDFPLQPNTSDGSSAKQQHSFIETPKINFTPTPSFRPVLIMPSATQAEGLIVQSPMRSRPPSPIVTNQSMAVRPQLPRSPSSPRPRRRSSQQRVSLVAGRVMIIDQTLAPQLQPLRRSNSSSSAISTAQSTRAPSPSTEEQSFLGEKQITDFTLESEIGRGAYGLVNRGREIHKDGTLGVRIGPPIL